MGFILHILTMIILPGLTLHYQLPGWLKWSCNWFPCLYIVVLELELASESPEGLVKTQIPGPHFLSFWVSRSGAGPENVHFDRPQVPCGPHFENHCFKLLPSSILHVAFWCSSLGRGALLFFRNFMALYCIYFHISNVLPTIQDPKKSKLVFHFPIFVLSHCNAPLDLLIINSFRSRLRCRPLHETLLDIPSCNWELTLFYSLIAFIPLCL